MKSLHTIVLLFSFISLSACNTDIKKETAFNTEVESIEPVTKHYIKVALLLDTSNSMDGLIDQAKAQLWEIVNELSYAKCKNARPNLEIALYEYGNDDLNSREGYLRKILAFTDDLDDVSKELFSLTTNGGSEYCGMVIQASLNQLDWGNNADDLKMIFIAGNEPFTQGNVDAGVSYNFLNFSGHVTAKNIIFQNRNLFTEDLEPNNQRTYLISSAYFVTTAYGKWAYEPSFLFQWKERTGEQSIDINFKAYRELEFGRIWAGLSYRNSFDGSEFLDGNEIKNQKLQYITPVLGVNYNKFMFAYTYTYQSGSVRFESGGFHQITLGYNFLEGKITRWSQDMRYNGMLRPNTRGGK